MPNSESFTPVILHDALYTPDMALTVMSISQIAKVGLVVSFQGKTCKITNGQGQVVGTIPSNNNGLYHMEHVCVASAAADEVINMQTLHRQLGHVAASTIHALIRSQAI